MKPRMSWIFSLFILSAGFINAAGIPNSTYPDALCTGDVVCQAATVTISFPDLLPYGGTVTASFSGILADGYLLYNVGDDIGELTTSDAKFSGNFPGHPNASADFGGAESLQWNPYYVFSLNFGDFTAGSPGDVDCFVDVPGCTAYIAPDVFGYALYSANPMPIVSVSFAPEPASSRLMEVSGCLLLLIAGLKQWKRRQLRHRMGG